MGRVTLIISLRYYQKEPWRNQETLLTKNGCLNRNVGELFPYQERVVQGRTHRFSVFRLLVQLMSSLLRFSAHQRVHFTVPPSHLRPLHPPSPCSESAARTFKGLRSRCTTFAECKYLGSMLWPHGAPFLQASPGRRLPRHNEHRNICWSTHSDGRSKPKKTILASWVFSIPWAFVPGTLQKMGQVATAL